MTRIRWKVARLRICWWIGCGRWGQRGIKDDSVMKIILIRLHFTRYWLCKNWKSFSASVLTYSAFPPVSLNKLPCCGGQPTGCVSAPPLPSQGPPSSTYIGVSCWSTRSFPWAHRHAVIYPVLQTSLNNYFQPLSAKSHSSAHPYGKRPPKTCLSLLSLSAFWIYSPCICSPPLRSTVHGNDSS